MAKRLRTVERPNPGRVHGGSVDKVRLSEMPRVRPGTAEERRKARRAARLGDDLLMKVVGSWVHNIARHRAR